MLLVPVRIRLRGDLVGFCQLRSIYYEISVSIVQQSRSLEYLEDSRGFSSAQHQASLLLDARVERSDIAGMWKNPVAHFQTSLVKLRQAGAQTGPNEKQAL